MKKVCIGLLLVSGLLFAQAASADPCGLCQAYYPCYWPCEHCTGLWTIDGYCMGEVIQGTCGDVGQCTGQPAPSNGEQPAAAAVFEPGAALNLCKS